MARTNQAKVKGLQPYNRFPLAPEADPLWLLDELWNIDKHRTLLVAVRHVNIRNIRPITRSGQVVDFVTHLGDAIPGAVVAEGVFIRTGPNPDLKVDADLSAKITFGKGCGAAERYEVVPLLREFEDDLRLKVLPKLHRAMRRH